MTDDRHDDHWETSSFDGSRREQLRQLRGLSVRQRLEALDQLRQLSERMEAMPRMYPGTADAEMRVREQAPDYGANRQINEIVLAGCSPTPLANYLKALGVLRLLSSRYPDTRAAWRGDKLILHTSLDYNGLEKFFLYKYEPTPVMAPWNGGSGFYFQERKSNEKDPSTGKKIKLGIRDQPTVATKVVDSVIESTNLRLQEYGSVLSSGRAATRKLGLEKAPDSGKSKDEFIQFLRATIPDAALVWLDAALLVTGEKTLFPPLLGSGGNDGNLDFTSNFMQRLLDVIGTDDELPENSEDWLRMALVGGAAPKLVKSNIGQFSPGQAGGPNATSGFRADGAINPWDFVLMIEGALPFAAAAVRRNADDPFGVLSYPFTVRAVGAGAGNVGQGDSGNARGELWMPLWDRPATYPEIGALLSEGRVALGRKPARDALDFARALHHLGGYRGVKSFQRFGLLMRSGNNFLATPLDRIDVQPEPSGRWVDDLDDHEWLGRFRRYAQGGQVPDRYKSLCRRLEDLLFRVSAANPLAADVQALIVLLGEIQGAIAVSPKAREVVPPVPRLTGLWVQLAAGRPTPAFRIACALAGLHGTSDKPLPIRSQLTPVHPRWCNVWITPEYAGKHVNDPACGRRLVTPRRGQLPEFMSDLLEDRLRLANAFAIPDKPLSSPSGVTLSDISVFLMTPAMDREILGLLAGLALCDIPRDVDRSRDEGVVPAAYALPRLCLTPDAQLSNLRLINDGEHVRIPPTMLRSLRRAATVDRGMVAAWRRLHASGLAPAVTLENRPKFSGIDPVRLTAALLIPLRFSASAALTRRVLKALPEHNASENAPIQPSNHLETSP